MLMKRVHDPLPVVWHQCLRLLCRQLQLNLPHMSFSPGEARGVLGHPCTQTLQRARH